MKIKKITIIFILIVFIGSFLTTLFPISPTASAATYKTSPIPVTVNIQINSGSSSLTADSSDSPTQDVVSIENQNGQIISSLPTGGPQFSNSYATYKVTFGQLTIGQSDWNEYVNGDLEACSSVSSGNSCVSIPVSTADQQNPTDPLNTVVINTYYIVGATRNPYPAGCYTQDATLSSRTTCPSGATDTNGQALNPSTDCYVEQSGPTISGESEGWVNVSCADLSTPIPAPTTTPQPSPAAPNSDLCQPGGINLSWFLCPIINGLADLEQDFETLISDLLQTPVILLNDGSKNCSSSQDCTDTKDIFNAWSNFRLYADVLLIVALLIAIIVEAAGGGVVGEAYTIKRMLPRILIAAILINLSIYLIAGLEDIFNIVGAGLLDAIGDVFGKTNWPLTPNGFTSDVTFISLLGGVSAVAKIAWSGEFIGFFGLFVLLPALFAIMAVFFTIVFRQGLLLTMLILSPIAFALYCLPNTEQYFRKWWGLLLKTLMVYPIMMVLFAAGDVGYRIMNFIATSGGSVFTNVGGLTPIIGLLPFIALLAPLFFMPFAFKMSGGAIGGIYNGISNFGKRATEAIKGNVNDPLSRRNIARRRLSDRVLRSRERVVGAGIRMQKSGGGFKRRMGGVMAGVTGGANYEIARSRMNKEALDLIQMHTSTGGDNLSRALFAKKLKYKDAQGNELTGWFGTDAAVDNDGFVTGKALEDGPKFADYEVKKAREFYGGSSSMYQAALNYELGKIGDDKEYGELLNRNIENFDSWAKPLRKDAGSIQLGAGFAQQASKKEGKHLKLKQATKSGVDANGMPYDKGDMYYDIDHAAFSRDMAEHVGNYQWASMNESTTKQMRDSFDWAQSVINAGVDGQDRDGIVINERMLSDAQRTKNDLQLSAQSIDTRYGGGATPVMGTAAAEGRTPPIEGFTQPSATGARRITTGAPGRVDAQINAFVDHVLGPVDEQGNRPYAPTRRDSDIRSDRGIGLDERRRPS